MKNKMICTLLTTVMVLSFAACGSQGNGAAASTESTVASESQVTESNAEANTETASTESTSTAEGAYEDNFAVPTEDATAFAKKIRTTVMVRQEMEQLPLLKAPSPSMQKPIKPHPPKKHLYGGRSL